VSKATASMKHKNNRMHKLMGKSNRFVHKLMGKSNRYVHELVVIRTRGLCIS
jgi:hypothetical protein